MRLIRTVACVLSLTAASPAFALSGSDWLTRVYNDVLFRDPTQQEIGSAMVKLALEQGATSEQIRMIRFAVANDVLTSDEYQRDLIGANPGVPGWFQVLLGRNPIQAYVFDVLPTLQAQGDEGAIRFIIETFSGFYSDRARANNPIFAACVGDEVMVNQLYIDLLGRNATSDEIDHTLHEALATILVPGFLTTPENFEYRTQVARAGFMRFLRREPRTAPGTSPDHNMSELDYYAAILGGVLFVSAAGPDESFYAYLLSSPEYGAGATLSMPLFGQPPLAAGTLVTNQIAGSPDPSAPPQLSLSQSLPPILLDPVVVSSSQTVLQLSVQAAFQEDTIDALVADAFGGPVTEDAALALLGTAQQSVAGVKQQVNACPPGFECQPAPEPKLLQHADMDLVLGYDALAAGDLDAAARAAKHAWSDAAHTAARLAH